MTSDMHTLSWLVGSWSGSLGDRSVDERWSPLKHGTIIGQARLCNDDDVTTIELILIRERQSSLELVLRQFEADLSPRLDQILTLRSLEADCVSFAAADKEDNRITGLTYRHTVEDGLEIDVGLTNGEVMTAKLTRLTA